MVLRITISTVQCSFPCLLSRFRAKIPARFCGSVLNSLSDFMDPGTKSPCPPTGKHIIILDKKHTRISAKLKLTRPFTGLVLNSFVHFSGYILYFYPRKNCPAYILPHWNTFLSTVQKYYNVLTGKTITPKTETAGRTYTVKHGDTLWQIAQTLLGKGSRYTEIVKLNGLKSNVLKTGQVLQIPEK